MKQIDDIEIAKAVINNDGVRCLVATEIPIKFNKEDIYSCVGGNFWGRNDEKWPVSQEGNPLIAWLQIYCKDLPYAYGPFYKKQLITFFISKEAYHYHYIATRDHSHFVVREYLEDETLVPLPKPHDIDINKHYKIQWEEKTDFPELSRYSRLFTDQLSEKIKEDSDFEFKNFYKTKIWGWPTPIQTNQKYPTEYVLQIPASDIFMYADCGLAYIDNGSNGWDVIFESG